MAGFIIMARGTADENPYNNIPFNNSLVYFVGEFMTDKTVVYLNYLFLLIVILLILFL